MDQGSRNAGHEEHTVSKTEELADAEAVKARQSDEGAEGLGGAADRFEQKLRETSEGVGEVVSAVSNRVRSSAAYLQEQGWGGVLDDIETLIKRYPIHAVLIGAGLGFILARGRSR